MMQIPDHSQSSMSETYRLPLWWPRDAVVLPTVPKEDRAEVIRRATSRVRSTVTAYDDVLITSNAHNVTRDVTLAIGRVGPA